MEEIWKDIPGYGNHYQASSLGRIRSKDRIVRKFSAVVGKVVDQKYKGRIIGNSKPDPEGYMHVHIGVNGKKCSPQIGRLVLLAFVGEPGPDEECCHGLGGPADNSIGNLRWDSHFENNQDRIRNGTYAIGSAHPMAKITEEEARTIKYDCKTPKEARQKFNLSASQYWRIKTGRSWPHI
jgi:hypothetical protein